jgi:hypothetical protein
MLLLDHIEKNYKVDKSQIFVTGLSMGGFGTWMCLNESPKRFAAAVPICGSGKPEWAGKLTDIPVWMFHGDKDPVVGLALLQTMVDAIKKAGGKKIIFTLYEGVGHNSWAQTYDAQMLYDWMFQQKLEGVNAPTARGRVGAALERVGVGTPREQTVEKQINDGKLINVINVRGEAIEKFSVRLVVSVLRADEKNFDRRYRERTAQILDRIATVLQATTSKERQEAGLDAIKERIKQSINEVLGTPWVQQVFCTEVELETR